MKLSKLVQTLEKIKREHGNKEVQEVIINDFEVVIIFENNFIVKI